MEHNKRIKIKAGLVDGNQESPLYVYTDQLAFFSCFDEDEKTTEGLTSFTLRWGIYNIIDELCEDDPTCKLVWDEESEEAYFVFDNEGAVGQRLKELKLL